tara:strand:- start:60 stop:596 length:537 start_codon:yes stop_codon:yes gene_type:complete
MTEKQNLMESIRDGIMEVKDSIKIPKSLSRYNPEKVAAILYLHSVGVTQTQMIKKYGLSQNTIVNVLVQYADYTNKWKELGAQIRGRHFMELSSLEEDVIDALKERMANGELKPTFRDLLPLSVALEKAEKGSNTFRGEVSNITEERKVVTQADYEATIEAAKKRMLQLKKADAIDYD